MMLPTAAAMTTRRSSFSEILGAGISPPPSLGVALESLREPRGALPGFRTSTLQSSQLLCARDAYNSSEKSYVELGSTSSHTFWDNGLSSLLPCLIPRHLTEGINGCQAYLNDWPTYFATDFWPEGCHCLQGG